MASFHAAPAYRLPSDEKATGVGWEKAFASCSIGPPGSLTRPTSLPVAESSRYRAFQKTPRLSATITPASSRLPSGEKATERTLDLVSPTRNGVSAFFVSTSQR